MTREPMNKMTVKAELGRNPELNEIAIGLPNATLFDLVDELRFKT